MLKKYSKNTRSNSYSRQSFASLFLWWTDKKSYKNNPNKKRNQLVDVLILKLLPILTISLFTLLYITSQFSTQKQITNSLKIKKNLIGAWAYSAQITDQMQASFDKNKDQAQVKIQRNESSIEFSLPIQESNIETQENQITYTNKALDQKINYQVIPNGIKEEILLFKRPASNIITTQLDLKNLTQTQINGLLVFFDQNQDYQFHFEKPFVEDSQGNRTYNVEYKLIDNQNNAYVPEDQIKKVSQELLSPDIPAFEGDQKYNLEIIIDQQWLDREDISYPIIIDPTVIHDESSEFNGYFDRVTDTGSGSAPTIETSNYQLEADANTVGLWHFDETADNSCGGGEDACDSSGNGNHGVATGTTIIYGKLSNARKYNGSSDVMNMTSLSTQSYTQATIEAWVKPNQTTSQTGYVVHGLNSGTTNRWWLVFYPANSSYNGFAVNFGGGYAASPTGSTWESRWYHVAGVIDSTGTKLYVDGELIGTSTATTINNIDQIRLAASATANFNGEIDELRISNVARTADEIRIAASARKDDGIYTSPVIDLTQVSAFDGLYWQANGIGTGDGETATPSATSALVGQWNFNETSGTTADNAEGTSALDGTLSGFTNTSGQDVAIGSGWTAGSRWGAGALMFDGSNDYVSVSDNNSLDISTSFTISAWVYSQGVQNAYTGIIGKDNTSNFGNYMLAYDSTGTIVRFGFYGTNATNSEVNTQTAIPTNQWVHLVGVFDDDLNTVSIYENGLLKENKTASNNPETNNYPFYIGSRGSNLTTYAFDGKIDVARIYNRALTASEILSNYNSSRIQFQTRTSADNSTWEAWSPATSETDIDDMDSPVNWLGPDISGVSTIATSSSTTTKIEGSGSLKIDTNTPSSGNEILHYNFDETNGDLAGDDIFDSSGNSNDGEIYGSGLATSVVEGISGKARKFNGSDDYIDATISNFTTGSAISYEAWFNPSSVDATQNIIIDKNYSIRLEINTSSKINVNLGNGSSWCATNLNGGPTIQANNWYHALVTYDNTTLRLYVNGVLANSTNTSCSVALSSIRIGEYINGSNYYFPGTIDELKIYSRALSAQEAHETYRLGRDHYINRTISSTDLSSKDNLPFYIAADEPGTYLQMTAGESAFANYQPDANTVHLFKMDEDTDDIGAYGWDARDSATGYNGWETGDTTPGQSGVIGKSRYFAGSADYLSVGNFAGNQLTTYTIDGWFKANSDVSIYRTITSKNNSSTDRNWWIDIWQTTGVLNWRNTSGGATNVDLSSTQAVNDDQWHYFAAVMDGATSAELYLDGKLVAEDTSVSTTDTQTAGITIGTQSDSTTRNFLGYLDEIRISNVARSASDIRQAYEVGRRTHPITIDFGASLNSGNLISSSADTSFTIDATTKGAPDMGNNLYYGDKVIVKENYAGTEYIAQGDVTSVNPSTGAVTIDGWDAGSTFPAGGYTVHATVFKWQPIYWDLSGISASDRNAITHFSLGITDGNEGRNIWLDDLRSNSGYLTNPFGSTITSTAQRYFQYRAIFSSSDSDVSAQLTSVTLDYSDNNPPTAPTSLQAETTTNPTNITDATPEFSAIYNDPDSGDTSGYYQLQVNTYPDFTGTMMWDTTKTAISSVTEGTRSSLITYAGTTLEPNTTYYWRIKFWDASDVEGAWSSESAYFSTTPLVTPAYCTVDELTDDSQLTIKWTDSNTTEDNYILEKNTNGGGYSSFQTLAANTTSYADSAVSQSNTYVYRVRAIDGDFTSPWCYTDQLSLQSGNFNFEGLNMEGLNID